MIRMRRSGSSSATGATPRPASPPAAPVPEDDDLIASPEEVARMAGEEILKP
jgi:hypothetical protein